MESAVLLSTVLFLIFSTVTPFSVAPLSSGFVSVRVSFAPVTSCFPVMSFLAMVSLETSSRMVVVPITLPSVPMVKVSSAVYS